MIGDELQHGRGHFRQCPGTGKGRLRRPLIAATNRRIFFSGILSPPRMYRCPTLSAFHGKNEPRRNIAHVDEVHDEIEIQLNAPAEKVPEHRRRRSEVVIMRSDRHCRSANHHRKTGCRSLQSRVVPPAFSIAYRDLACRRLTAAYLQQRHRLMADERKRIDSVEQCRNRAMPRLRAAAITISVPRQLTA